LLFQFLRADHAISSRHKLEVDWIDATLFALVYNAERRMRSDCRHVIT